MLNFKYIRNALDNKRATSIFLMFVISGFAIFAMMLINDIYVQTKLENNWTVIQHVYQKAESEATAKNLEITAKIEKEVEKYIKEDIEKLRSDFASLDKVNRLTTLLNMSITDKYLFDIQNDNNDPFIMNKERIITDKSFNCSKEFGITRGFEEEVSMHFNKVLAQKALDSIVQEDISDVIIWSFLSVDETLPWYRDAINLKYVDMTVLKELYMKHGGDIRILANYEFLVPHFIYKNSDLIGNQTVNAVGIRTENYQLTLVQGFNIVDVIKATNYMPILEQNTLAISAFTAMTQIITLTLIALCLTFFMVTWGRSKH